MVINENAYYRENENQYLWCAYELKDHQGNYKEEYRLFMRKESQDRKFFCPDCGEPLILCAGLIMEPFFKHYENSLCVTANQMSSQKSRIARRMLYQLARRSFPEDEIQFNRPIEEGVQADLLIEKQGRYLALQYLGYEMMLGEWEEKHRIFQDNGIEDLWFLNGQKYGSDKATTFEYLVSKTTDIMKLIDFENNCFVLKSRHNISANNSFRWFCKSYEPEELALTIEGEIICDFIKYQQDEIDSMEKRYLLEEKHRLDTLEKSKEKLALLSRKEEKALLRMDEDMPVPYRTFAAKKGEVKRRSLDSVNIATNSNKGAMKMVALGEWWDIPALTGKDWQIRNAEKNRYAYLKKFDQKMSLILDNEEKQEKIKWAIEILETSVEAILWK